MTASYSKKCAMAATALAGGFLIAGCEGAQSTLDPRGPEAAAIAQSTWIMIWAGTAIFVLVMALALYAVYRTPGRRMHLSSEAMIVGGGVIFPVVALSALLVYGVPLMGDLRAATGSPPDVRIIGHQWWWEVQYGESVVTANELRLPAGRPVALALESRDVIHSFWVPNLAGKLDLVPGRTTRITVQADRAGVFRGQCAEFCGAQHARMALHVRADPPQVFEQWLAQQREDAAPRDAEGKAHFVAHCAECHTVRGITAGHLKKQPGPDLTHLASRPWLGAGALENTPANLVEWIAHNQRIKPGNRMPGFAHLDRDTLQAIAAFLTEPP